MGTSEEDCEGEEDCEALLSLLRVQCQMPLSKIINYLRMIMHMVLYILEHEHHRLEWLRWWRKLYPERLIERWPLLHHFSLSLGLYLCLLLGLWLTLLHKSLRLCPWLSVQVNTPPPAHLIVHLRVIIEHTTLRVHNPNSGLLGVRG